MLSSLKKYNRWKETVFLGKLSVLCFGISVFRFVYSESSIFLFLNWNLFLAFLPWLFSILMIINPKLQENKAVIVVLLLSWLVFFPNAPYILTDLFHLQLRLSMPIWFDLVFILSYAWTGLLFGFISLWNIEEILVKTINEKTIPYISGGLLFLGSFGIYLGRYLRWNSWDILRDPFGLFHDIHDRIMNPFDHPDTWGMTLFMGLFLNIVYWSFRMIRKKHISIQQNIA